MPLAVQADFTVTEDPPSGFEKALNDGIEAIGGIGEAVTTSSAAAMSDQTEYDADQEAAFDLSYMTFQTTSIYGHLATVGTFTSNHYRVEIAKPGGNALDTIKIISRKSGTEVTLDNSDLVRGFITTGKQLKIKIFDAGTTTVIQSWYDSYLIAQVVDASSPIQGAGFVGAHFKASNAGMGIDNFLAANLTVVWASDVAVSNPTQTQGDDSTGDGSFLTPYQSIQFAADDAQMTAAGEVCMVRAGTYDLRLNENFGNLVYQNGSSLVAENWDGSTVIQAFPGETITTAKTTNTSIVGFSTAPTGRGIPAKYIQFINLHWLSLSGREHATHGGSLCTIQRKAEYIRIQGGSGTDCPATGAFNTDSDDTDGITNYHQSASKFIITVVFCQPPIMTMACILKLLERLLSIATSITMPYGA